jgi:uncharacterized protein (TIGR02266 family)
MGPQHARVDERPRRIDVRVPVEILCSRGIKLCGKTRNVSTGGMFVETGLLLPVGSPVRLDVALDQRPIELIGRVAWSRQKGPSDEQTPGMGIQFVGFEADARRVLDDVVEETDGEVTAVEPYDSVEITAPTAVIAVQAVQAVPVPVADVEPTEKTNFTDVRTPRRVALGVVFMSVAAVAAAIVLTLLPGGSDAREPAPVAAVVHQAPTPIPAPAAVAVAEPELEPEPMAMPDPIDDIVAEPEPAPKPTLTPTPKPTPKPKTSTTSSSSHEVAVMPRRDGTTVIVVPLDREPSALRHYKLASPDGIAIRLDGATTATERGVFRQEFGATQKIWLPANGREVRVLTRGPVPSYAVEANARELRVTLQPATSVSR